MVLFVAGMTTAVLNDTKGHVESRILAFLTAMIAVSVVIAFLTMILSLYTAVNERTRKIGILKGLGMSKGRIILLIEWEAGLISFVGIIAGYARNPGSLPADCAELRLCAPKRAVDITKDSLAGSEKKRRRQRAVNLQPRS
jgi:hypothetical protein